MDDKGITLFAVLLIALPSLLCNLYLYIQTRHEAERAIEAHSLMLKILRTKRRR